jgi:hypothetical protein
MKIIGYALILIGSILLSYWFDPKLTTCVALMVFGFYIIANENSKELIIKTLDILKQHLKPKK